MRPITAADLASLDDFLSGIFRFQRGVFDQRMVTDFPLVFRPENFANSRVIIHHGRIVSHAALWSRELIVDDRRLKLGALSAVATDPQMRGQGLAGELVADLQRTLREEGFDLGMLWTAVPDFYFRLGWQAHVPHGEFVTLSLAEAGTPLTNTTGLIRLLNPEVHLDGVISLHEREAVRLARSRDDYRQLLSLPKVQTWVADEDGKVRAYLVSATAANKQGLIEYGGDADAILDLIRHALRERSTRDAAGNEVSWVIYSGQPDLLKRRQELGWPAVPLAASKGMKHTEMVLPMSPSGENIVRSGRLFVWGLDWV